MTGALAVTVAPVALELEWLRAAVEAASGWPGLVVVFVYSFLIAVVLPLPSEVVLAAPLELGLPVALEVGLIVVVSGVGKAAGSVLALYFGRTVRDAGPVTRAVRRAGFDPIAWSERKATRLAQKWGFVGLALALSVPGFPDTVSLYAFAVLEDDYVRFAAAAFAGSVGRLLVTLGVLGGVMLW